jgi:hypothetical protein
MKIAKLRGLDDQERLQRFNIVYSNLLQKIKYRAKTKAIYGIIKSQGDIMIEYRELSEAIIAYKTLVSLFATT